MVKNILLLLLFVLTTVGCSDNNAYTTIIEELPDLPEGYTYIPDNNFEQALMDLGYDKTDTIQDDMVLTSQIENIKELHIDSLDIYKLTGIEDFKSLEILYCDWNKLTELDLSQNKALIKLDCKRNQIRGKNLKIDNNPKLTYLDCWVNEIASLDLTKNINLDTLECSSNRLSQLDLTQNKKLRFVNCNYNQILTLSLNNPELRILFCDGNQLQTLDLKNCQSLGQINCRSNLLDRINFKENNTLRTLIANDNNFESIDLSNCTNLGLLFLHRNKLTKLNIRNGNNHRLWDFAAFQNPLLKCIQVDDVAWSTANWTDIDESATFSENCGY